MAEAERLTVQGKLKKIRRKLAALEYHEPLNADTLPLVDHLLGDLIATTESYESLQVKEESYSNELKAVRAQVMPLRKEASSLRSENNVLHEAMIRKEDEMASRDRTFTLERHKLENELALAVEGCKERDLYIMKIELQTKRLRNALSKALSPAAAAEEPLFLEADEDTGETGKNFRWPSARWSSSIGNGTEGGGYEGGVGMSSITLEAHQLEVEALENSVEMRDKEIARLCDQLNSLNEKVLNNVTLHSTHENNKAIIGQLHQQVDFLNSQLASREVQLRRAHSNIREVEIELSKSKVEGDDYRKELEKHAEAAVALSSRPTTELIAPDVGEDRRKAAAEASLFAVTQECSSLLERVQQLEAELRHVRSVANESKDKVETAERRLKIQLQDIASLTTRAERAEANADMKARECLSLREQIREVEGKMDGGGGSSSDLAQKMRKVLLVKQQYEERIKNLQEQLAGYRNGLIVSSQTELTKERDAVHEERIENLEEQLAGYRNGLIVSSQSELTEERGAVRDEYQQCQTKRDDCIVQLEAELSKQKLESRRLRSLIHAMEEGRESAAQVLGISKKQFQGAREAVVASEANSANLRSQVSVQEQRISYLEQSLRAQGEEHEALQKKLNDVLEEHNSALLHITELKTRSEASDGVVSLASQRLKELSEQLDDKENRLAKSQQWGEDLHGQLTALQSMYTNRVAELRSASDDLNLLTRENHAMAADMSRLATEREASAAEVAELRKEDDILSAYRALLEDRNHIESNAHETAASNEHLSAHVSKLEGELATARASLRGVEVELSRRSHSLSALHSFKRHVESQSEELQRSGRRAEAIKEENRQVRQEMESQRAHTGNVMERIRVQQVTSAAAADELSGLRARILVLEQERDSLSKILIAERAQGAGLEEMIESGRSKEAKRDAQLKRLEQERASLESQLLSLQHELNTTRDITQMTLSSNASISDVGSSIGGKAGGSIDQEGEGKRMTDEAVVNSNAPTYDFDPVEFERQHEELSGKKGNTQQFGFEEGEQITLLNSVSSSQPPSTTPSESSLDRKIWNGVSAVSENVEDLEPNAPFSLESVFSPGISDTTCDT